jgi:hypothetical protein
MRWRGREITQEQRRAAMLALNETMGECVKWCHVPGNHPGWINRTSTAQNSVKIQKHAGSDDLTGEWGSIGVDYMMWLEKKHGNMLQNSADRHYPNLIDNIRKRL